MTQIDRIISKGQLVPIVLMQDNLAANQSAVALTVAEVASAAQNAVDSCVMPFSGEIVAITGRLSAAATAGNLSVAPTVNGTAKTDPVLAVTTGQSPYDTAPRSTTPFAAGDRIGAKVTTDGSWDGTTADIVVVVWVLLYIEGI